MDSFKQLEEAAKEFDLALAEALKLPHMTKHLKYAAKYSELYFHFNGSTEEVEQHIEFLKNLAALRRAIDDPANNPRELKVIRDSKDRKVRAYAAKYIPSLKEVIEASIKAVKYERFDDGIDEADKRVEVFKYLNSTLAATTDLVNSRFQDPRKLDVLFTSINPVVPAGKKRFLNKPSSLTLFAARHPNVTLQIGALTLSAGFTLVLAGAVMCAAPGCLPIGLAMIAAGILLSPIGAKIFLAARKFVDESKSKIKKEVYALKLQTFGERYKKLIASPEVTKVFKNAERQISRAADTELQPLDGLSLSSRNSRLSSNRA
jgi:hypothetical protein